jgi:acetylornithine aminotransferase
MASLKASEDSIMNTYSRLPIAFNRGEGAWLIDDHGERYLDAISGIAVVGLGHSHPKITKTIQDQAETLLHTSNLYHINAQQSLARELTGITGLEAAFFCNSGAEANEAAIKLARLHGHNNGIEQPHIIVMENAFHGRTLATLSASGNRKVQAGFEPLVSGFLRAPFNDIKAIERLVTQNTKIAAILVESVQGEGGVRPAHPEYLEALRRICDEQNWLLMLDEVQSGNGRTGKYFSYQHTQIKPDVVVTAKGLGNGIPIGAIIANQKANALFKPGHHGSTFGGNPFACTVALQVVKTLFDDHLIERASHLGERILNTLIDQLEGADYVQDIRGQGLMIGVELTQPCGELVALAKARKLLINVTQGSVIRLLPPLTLTDDEADMLASEVSKLIKTYMGDDRSRPR